MLQESANSEDSWMALLGRAQERGRRELDDGSDEDLREKWNYRGLWRMAVVVRVLHPFDSSTILIRVARTGRADRRQVICQDFAQFTMPDLLDHWKGVLAWLDSH